MASPKRPPLPLILAANDLLDGFAVYRRAEGWSADLADALVARDEADAVKLEAALADSEAKGDVVEPYLVPVSLDAEGRIFPLHYRERIRALGPTIRLDLGPQAQGEHGHVSV